RKIRRELERKLQRDECAGLSRSRRVPWRLASIAEGFLLFGVPPAFFWIGTCATGCLMRTYPNDDESESAVPETLRPLGANRPARDDRLRTCLRLASANDPRGCDAGPPDEYFFSRARPRRWNRPPAAGGDRQTLHRAND